MDLSLQYATNLKLSADSPIDDTKIIKDLISKDLDSHSKKKMNEGVNYYNAKHDIENRKMYYYDRSGLPVEDKLKANNKAIHAFHKILVDQKTAYLVGKPIKFYSDDKKHTEDLNALLGEKWDDIANELVKNVSNKGKEWLHPFINEAGEFDYIIIPAEQVIPIYDTATQRTLVSLIRYYSIDIVNEKGEEQTRYKVEWWDKDKVTYYMQDENDNFYFDTDEPINPRYFLYEVNSLNPNKKEPNSWGKIPIIEFKNNEECISDLRIYKNLIDSYDMVQSDFLNNLEDVADIIWGLVNYDGEDLREFLYNLKVLKAVPLGENGDIKPFTNPVPHEAREVILKRLKEDIFIFGQGVDVGTDKFGNNPTGVALQFLYALLDLKCDILERKMKRALRELIWFISEYLNRTKKSNYDYKTMKITFNRSMITNETEMIDNAIKSVALTSEKTALSMHPKVDNVDEEVKEKRKEEKEGYSDYGKLNGDEDEE